MEYSRPTTGNIVATPPESRVRNRLIERGRRILDHAEAENRDITDAEVATLEALKAEITDQDRADEARSKYAPLFTGERVWDMREHVYRPDAGPSFFRDLISATRGDGDAAGRLSRHEKIALETRAGTTGLTSMGAFIPPAWLLDEYAPLARAGRVVANLVSNRGEPTSDSMVVPRITTGTAVTIQASENASLGTQDAVTAQITRATSTIGGYVDTSVQSLELGNPGTDRIIFSDLTAAYQAALDLQLITGSGASGQLLGLDSLTGLNAVTYTSASPTVAELNGQVANASSQAFTGRLLSPDGILMNPRRWAWISSKSGTDGRPIVAPVGAINNPGSFAVVKEGASGTFAGLPVYVSANIPTSISTNQDEVYVARFSDMILYESPIRAEVFRDVGSANATVRFRLYAFVNFFAGRFPAGVSQIRGTGLATPTFG